ncbi:hypothetical protein QBC40DRAFT_298586 [Triangularia verruculosa]|uniref:Uncharacterized protein n=1 Tax=Triangularia verruculosa TaxID=2587418 RepID=A0AAN6XD37_9PEZI|nr:hypothetical protein QBC40DRAFT_298586 [Triangularia verruculosa]
MIHISVLTRDAVQALARSRRYVNEVGAVSLASLLIGSAILLFVASNIGDSWSPPGNFKIGSHLPVQFWLAVLGIGFSLLAYGLSESYYHLFDVWCTRKAGSEFGLDYARYLNTQPRAPVAIGLRGFRCFVLIRYLVILLGIGGSIGYKFAIVQITETYLELDETAMKVSLPSIRPIDLGTGELSPWLRDGPTVEANRAFLHYNTLDGRHANIAPTISAMDRSKPPGVIFMSGEADCLNTFHKFDEGLVVSLELVTVANLEIMYGDSEFIELVPGEWARIARNAAGWLEGETKGLIIDYRHEMNGTLRIRWAEIPEWADETRGTFITKQPIAMSLKYTIGLALTEVTRFVASNGCWRLKEIVLTESQISTIPLEPPPMDNENFITTLLKDSETTILDGVSAIVRSSMNTWAQAIHASESPAYTPGHAPLPSQISRWALFPPHVDKRQAGIGMYFDKESGRKGKVYLWSNATLPQHVDNPEVPQTYAWQVLYHGDTTRMRYPYYKGTSAQNTGVGAYRQAGIFFITLSVAACLLVITRLCLGPAGLTSWMGQHVYLALDGKVQKEGSEILACGHRVACNLGTVRIGTVIPTRTRNKMRMDPSNYTGLWLSSGGL